ncbi:MAG: bifunctional phosphopantothenoylcysteine decarboxylase/phosphopantothenate--cysteine ligase CoaBC [Oceanospirillaceae bacterium]|nr:bifunctional phosphopantothenoylcysteine decarboxylase/phosphopantothenate--cysteine ligase CoaBC [Oceanospirillaceae bacterium]
MQRLTNKRIILGITGGIAAYKSAELTRFYKSAGADVRIVMTHAATQFITSLTLQALSGNTVHTSLLDPEAEAGMGHIELARWADIIVIAPASADFMARLESGMANDLLTTLCLATDAPLVLAPAMNQAMWRSAHTQKNLKLLEQRDITFWGPASGEQACGDVGPGRMLEPIDIALLTAQRFSNLSLSGKTVHITAGPTREAIDPVRYISNHSSGKMGYAIAQAAIEAGAKVKIISGPVNIPCPDRVDCVQVESADQMLAAVLTDIDECDIFIGCAAVADFKPAVLADNKLKKGTSATMTLELVKNPDIVATVAARSNKPFTVGFAAETQNLLEHARAKLSSKNLDLIAANDVANAETGFNADSNALTLISADDQQHLALTSKTKLAQQLVAHIAELVNR